MVQKLTENGHNARGPLRYLTTVVVELYTEAQTGTEWHRLTQTVRRTDRRIEGRRRRRADNNQWDAICNRDDCHADITHRSAVRGLVPSSPPRLKKTATMPYHLLVSSRVGKCTRPLWTDGRKHQAANSQQIDWLLEFAACSLRPSTPLFYSS